MKDSDSVTSGEWKIPTIDGGEHHPGVVVGDDVCIAVLWFIHFHVGVLPGELLARVDGLQQRRRRRWGGVGWVEVR